MGQNGTQFHSPNVGTAPRFPTVVRERVRREAMEIGAQKASSLRWKLLRQALLRRHRLDLRSSDERSEITVNRISRKSKQGFNLIRCQFSNNDDGSDDSASSSKPNDARDVTLSYILPLESSPRLVLTQRASNVADLSDLEFCNNHNIDNTGIVCQWPSEDVLAYFCLSHADMFRSKRVIELGAGYGLAGLVIAAVTDASEVVISDGNPQVVNYIESNIEANSKAFGDTQVKPMKLHWSRDKISDIAYSFDLIVASDCTFFKEFHTGLAQLVNCLLKKVGPCEAMFFSPKRGDSLDRFLEEITVHGLKFSITEKYDDEIWKCHQSFINGDDDSWPSYEKDHCYPLLVRITR